MLVLLLSWGSYVLPKLSFFCADPIIVLRKLPSTETVLICADPIIVLRMLPSTGTWLFLCWSYCCPEKVTFYRNCPFFSVQVLSLSLGSYLLLKLSFFCASSVIVFRKLPSTETDLFLCRSYHRAVEVISYWNWPLPGLSRLWWLQSVIVFIIFIYAWMMCVPARWVFFTDVVGFKNNVFSALT